MIRKTKNNKASSGFIALMSAIIISVILLLITANLNLSGFYGRSNILDWELKEKSSALADACVDIILLRLAQDPGYTGGETITVSGEDTCIIFSTSGTNPRVFNIQAKPMNYYTNFEVTIDVSRLEINDWEEI
jgi:hypothetical protein